MNPEIGHVLMGYEDLAYAYSWPLAEGRLAHTHCNSQPLGNYDQDLNVGVVSPEQLEAMLYTLKMHGYTGLLRHRHQSRAHARRHRLQISMDALRAANDRINDLDHEAILFAHNHPDKARGWLEAYLIRARAPIPIASPPSPPSPPSHALTRIRAGDHAHGHCFLLHLGDRHRHRRRQGAAHG
jgi:xylose isomerase